MMLPAEKHLEILSRHLELKDSTILDVGAGGGEVSSKLRGQGARVVGLECSRNQMNRAVEHQREGCCFVYGVCEDLPLRQNSFDATVFLNSMHHIPESFMDKAILEVTQVTKPGGMIYIAEPLAEGPCFELDSSVEDETEVREKAQQALNQSQENQSNWRETQQEYYQVYFDYNEFEEYKDEMLRFDSSRKSHFERIEDKMKKKFLKLSEKTPQGFRFYQPMLARCFLVSV